MRDSALTSHGVLQTERLGRHLAASGIVFTHIFSSDLQRAFKTAEAIRTAQNDESKVISPQLKVSSLPVLREQDFGSYEGKPYRTRPRQAKGAGVITQPAEAEKDSGFREVESRESMAARMTAFIEAHLMRLLTQETPEKINTVAVVSHGIVLTTLWGQILQMCTRANVSAAPGVLETARSSSLEHLGGWSNTGYLEIILSPVESSLLEFPVVTELSSRGNIDKTSEGVAELPSFRLRIITINGQTHLQNLKRTRGGLGSSKHDEGQQKIEQFFKKRKMS